MKSRISLLLIAVYIITASTSFAQETVVSNDKDGAITAPYVAEITGTDVYVRSGAGQAYYYCSKLNSPDKITVVDKKFGWLKIVPPEGSFSWISKAYVDLDPDNPGIGIVKGDSVRVWAGSNYVDPMSSSSLQQKLYKGDGTNQGDTVKLIADAAEGDYYKIYPPSNSYLWVHEQYTKYYGPVPEPEPMVLPPKPESKTNPEEAVAKVDKTVEKVEKKVVAIKKEPSAESAQLAKCYELAKEIDTELAKSAEQQNYTAIKKLLKKISNDPDAGKAPRYAEYQLSRIDRYELALEVTEQVRRQDAELSKTRNQIRKSYFDKLAQIPDAGKYVIVGIIKPSYIYTKKAAQKRYLIVDNKGKAIGYAMAGNNSVGTTLDNLVDVNVGLIGEAVTDSYSPLSLIKVTKIVTLEP